jgi:ABC-2 type transport system permease protein
MMRKLLNIAWNDIRIEFSERSTLVFFIVLPLVFTLIIGLGLQGMYGNSDPQEDPRYPIFILDEDHSGLSAQLSGVMQASEVIRPVPLSQEEVEGLFARDQALAAVTIPAGFERALLQQEPTRVGLRTRPNDNRALVIERALQSVVSQLNSAVQIAHASVSAAQEVQPFESVQARQDYFADSLNAAQELLQDPPVRAQTTQSPQVTVDIPTGFEQSSPGQLVTWTLITLLGASEVFVNERLGGTLRRLLVTPTRKATILTGKITGRLSMGILQMTILIAFGALVLNVNWGRSWAALTLIMLAFALAAVALGVLLGALARTRSQASGLTTMFAMLLAALGGAWWPLEITPPAYQTLVKALPTTWAMIGFNDVIVRGQGVQAVLPETAILLAFAVIFFAVGVWRLRFE